MTRLLACVALILAMTLALDRGIAAVLGHLLLGSDDRFVGIYRPDPGPAPETAVVVLGNSRADNHFPADRVAELACGRAVNLGMGGAPMVVSEVLWKDWLERHGPPRLLILEPTGVMDDPATLSDAPMLAHWSARMDALVRETDEALWWSGRLFRLLAFNSNQAIRTAVGLLRPGGSGDRTLTGTIDAAHRARIERMSPEAWTAHPRNLAALDRIVESARAEGVPVMVVLTPLHPPFVDKLVNYERYFAALTGRLPPEVRVADLRDAVTGDDRFVDPLHVNREGVRLMLARLEAPLARAAGCPRERLATLDAPVPPPADRR